MSLLYVFVATKAEADSVVRTVDRNARRSGPTEIMLQIGPNEVMVTTTGIGPRQARARAEQLLSKGRPEGVIITGSCGSLTETLVEGGLVIYTDCLSGDGRQAVPCSAPLTGLVIERLHSEGLGCTPAAI